MENSAAKELARRPACLGVKRQLRTRIRKGGRWRLRAGRQVRMVHRTFYRFVRNWSAGLEFWNHHEFADATVHEHSAYFLGPTIHYGGERWWATLGFLHQLPIGQAFSHDNKELAAHDGDIVGDEHAEYYVRFSMGLNV